MIIDYLYNAPRFKEGDIVKCFDTGNSNLLIYGKEYIVISIYQSDKGSYLCDLIEKESSQRYDAVYCARFVTIIEFDANKYNI